MLLLVDKPSIQYVVEEAVASGIEDILIVTGRGKQAIEDHFDCSVELEQLLTDKGDEDKLGWSGPSPTWLRSTTSARRPRSASATPSASPSSTSATSRSPSCWATTSSTRAPSCSDLITSFERHGTSVVAAMEVERSQIKAYGCVAPADEVEPGLLRMADIVEKPAPEEAPRPWP